MGTNFYVEMPEGVTDIHVGKRSAAGPYCWDCKTTLCIGGTSKLHTGPGQWNPKCPKCGNSPTRESIFEGTSGLELGFNKSTKSKNGVSSCCSFNWAITRDALEGISRTHPYCKSARDNSDPLIIYDEHGDRFTLREFLSSLEICPIQLSTLDREFS